VLKTLPQDCDGHVELQGEGEEDGDGNHQLDGLGQP